MIRHTQAPPYLKRYTTLISASATATVETFEVAPNSALAIAGKGDQSYTLRCIDLDPTDLVEFGYTDYTIASTGTPVYHRSTAGAIKVQIIAGLSDTTPDLRIYGMSQP